MTTELEKSLEDWQVGDIALCPDGMERTIHERNDRMAHWILSEDTMRWRMGLPQGCDSFWKQTDMMEVQRPLQNPPFRVGDKVRFRLIPEPTIQTVEHVHGSATVFLVGRHGQVSTHVLALVERAPKGQIDDSSNTAAKVETERTLPDIRVGDIMVGPDGVERAVEDRGAGVRWYPDWRGEYRGQLCLPFKLLRNPPFRVGDTVRHRKTGRTYVWPKNAPFNPDVYALVERAPVEKKRAGPWVLVQTGCWERRCAIAAVARIEEGGEGEWHSRFMDQRCCSSLENCKAWCDGRMRAAGWVLEDAPVKAPPPVLRAGPWQKARNYWYRHGAHADTGSAADNAATVCPDDDLFEAAVGNHCSMMFPDLELAQDWCDAQLLDRGYTLEAAPSNRCKLCGHPGEKHYAGCCSRDPQTREPHTRNGGLMTHAGSRADTWLDAKVQPAPIVLLAQNDEDVP